MILRIMKFRPYASLVLIFSCLFVTILSQAFNTTLYSFDGSPAKWLSFSISDPLRYNGLTLLSSPFMHVSASHLLVNLFFLGPVALLIERKESGPFLMKTAGFIHLLVLILLILTAPPQYAFLGASHLICGLYTYWGLRERQWSLLFVAVMFIGVGVWEGQSLGTLLAHLSGAFAAILLLIIGHLRRKVRSQCSN